MKPADRYTRFWQSLPETQRTAGQIAGVTAVGCGATHSIMERCNFSCTSCYLSAAANATRPAPFEDVCRQLDDLRSYLGPAGKCQITSGEVTLLPAADLGRIVAYALSIGLDPMVMTNGERLLDDPAYLPTLVRDHGLRKVSFHVDSTQRGRPGWRRDQPEQDLHALRDRFADLVRSTRRQTGAVLHAAMTMTVTEANADGVPTVIDWALDNADAIRLVSFLPVAPVGRTTDARASDLDADLDADLDLDGVWRLVCRGAGQPLHRDALRFGHRECNITVPVLILHTGADRHIVEVVRQHRRWDRRIMRRALREFAPQVQVDDRLARTVLRLGMRLLTRPLTLVEVTAYAVYRASAESRALRSMLAALLRGRRLRLRPQMVVVHKFMGADEIDTDLGRERLQACVFRVPVDGQMVSMCQVNAGDIRRTLNDRLRRVSAPDHSSDHSTANRTPQTAADNPAPQPDPVPQGARV